MRRLILQRHAKSSWDHHDLDDHARPLSDRGTAAASAMGGWLRDAGLAPTRVLCSDALRTLQTWALMADELGDPVPEVEVVPELYLASRSTILDIVGSLPASVMSAMVIGHNPGTHELAHRLTDPARVASPNQGRRLAARFPTGAAAVLEFDAPDWRQLSRGQGLLRVFMRPADLPGAGTTP